jgi:sugar O-acyltransferase (sialic acid O-acetyltransferase NeuD family)
MARPVVVFGCGSQGRYCVDNLGARAARLLALVDVEAGAMVGREVNGVPVRWNRASALAELEVDSVDVIVAHGDNELKLRIAEELAARGFRFASAVHPAASISPSASIAAGCIVNAGAIVLPDAVIEPHVIIHSGAVIEHDCVIGAGTNVAPGVRLAGRVRVGRLAYLYTGCIIVPELSVGERAVVGAGAVVLEDVPDGACVVGNPARRLR